jgi:hypothetical protein
MTRQIYFDGWEDGGMEKMGWDFQCTPTDLVDIEVLFASYTYEDYDGYAFVLFRKDGKLYEVHGSHCSCFGLEGQWDPQETTLASLQLRYERTGFDSYTRRSEPALQAIKLLEAEQEQSRGDYEI